ncbi:prolyl-tRNA synthetase associated domain-containing protein [Pusillimonas sp. SM2304]|uniref:prolyl-tRNA synthetase associated domain-containing protein n=1 Tax=Pusillimonas sp. SM2304 TaxID=3073241 RepID=UPI0028771297|nr:prolyl-tRNA synthetase associated domain-containing protein [Pusillimonas sp. SM2304]MDS1138880.1 prolyl-tRNA synthetase associated domain-containing protein [Pusillimonas sp. SM2304]
MQWTQEKLLAFLNTQGIDIQQRQHPAVFTMAESAGLNLNLPGTRCKNLLVRNKKNSHRYLIVTPPDAAVDLGALGKLLASGRLSLCSPADMLDLLGVAPGAMSPLSLIADQEAQQIQLIMDADLAASRHFQFHPLVNTATIAISQEDFRKFLAAVNQSFRYLPIPRRIMTDTPVSC